MKRYLITGPADAVRGLCAAIYENTFGWVVLTCTDPASPHLQEGLDALDAVSPGVPAQVLAFPGCEPQEVTVQAFGGERWEVKAPIRPSIWRVLADSPTGKTYATHNGDTWAEALESAVAASA